MRLGLNPPMSWLIQFGDHSTIHMYYAKGCMLRFYYSHDTKINSANVTSSQQIQYCSVVMAFPNSLSS